jgi:hypothetical protein
MPYSLGVTDQVLLTRYNMAPPPARIGCFVISVDASTRNPSLEADLLAQGVVPNGLIGVDFRRASERDVAQAQDADSIALLGRSPLSGGEIGCLWSHRLAWRTALAESFDWLLVVEDDVTICGDLRGCLEHILAENFREPTIVSLIHPQGGARNFPLWAKPRSVSVRGIGFHRSITQTWGTVGYLVNQAALRLLTKGDGPAVSVADWPPEAAGCRFYVAIPPPLFADDGGNLIPEQPSLASGAPRGALSRVWNGVARRVRQYARLRRRLRSPLRFLVWNQGAWPLYGTRIPTWTIRATRTEGGETLWWWRLSRMR